MAAVAPHPGHPPDSSPALVQVTPDEEAQSRPGTQPTAVAPHPPAQVREATSSLRKMLSWHPPSLKRTLTLVPGRLSHKTAHLKIFAELALAEWRQTVQGLALAAMAVPLTLVMARSYNHSANDGAARGDLEVRYPHVAPTSSTSLVPSALTVEIGAVWVVVMELQALSMCLNARLMLHNLGRGRRRLRRYEALLYLSVFLLVGWGMLWDWNRGVQRAALFLGLSSTLGLHAKVVGESAGSRTLAVLLFLQAWSMLTLASVQSWWVGPWLVSSDTGDAGRLLWSAVGQPVMVELALAPMRVTSRLFPGLHVERTLCSSMWVIVQSHMMNRWLVTTFRGTEMTLAAVAVVTASDTLRRGTVLMRERALLTLWWRGDAARAAAAADSRAAHETKATVSVLEELAEVVGVSYAAALTLVFRVSTERAAPEAGAVLLSALLQIAVGQLRDLAVHGAGLSMAAEEQTGRRTGSLFRKLGQMLKRVAIHSVNAHSRWTTAFWLVLAVMSAASALFFALLAFEPEMYSEAMYCPWSRHGGWWHWAPCAHTGDWLGLR